MAAIGVLMGSLGLPSVATAANVWVTLAAGIPGSDVPTSSSEFFFDNPHAPFLAVNDLNGATALATTGGGNTFFGGAGTPVLLNLADGSAYLASGNPPAAATTLGGTPASAAPVAGGSLPTSAALLGITLAEPANGTRALTASVTDSRGNALGSGALVVPDNGWWVLGLTPAATPVPDPGPIVDPPIDPLPGGVPGPLPGTPPPQAPPPGSIATPEPATLILAAIGGLAAHAWRRSRSWSSVP